MPDPAKDYNICPCCGTEFGSDDETRTHAQLREFWISSGAKWFFREPPPLWNPWQQLSDAGVVLPYAGGMITSVTASAFIEIFTSKIIQSFPKYSPPFPAVKVAEPVMVNNLAKAA
ncbi:MAG: hypothetical protein ABI357_03865 [Granulicella sp.]